MKHSIFVLTIIIALLFVTHPVSADEYQIKPGDTLGVTVLGEPDLTKRVIVSTEGSVTLPLVNEVKVTGMTTIQAAEEITKQFKRFVKNPQVVVELAEPAKMQVTILGEVLKPGVIPIQAGAKLADAITSAGGYSPNADLTKIRVSHADQSTTTETINLSKFLLSGDASVNILISPGDTIAVPSIAPQATGTVMVLGAVKEAGAHPLSAAMTLREAVMLAGGPTELADLSNVSIRHENATDAVKINFADAATGDTAANPLLKPGDIIFVSAKEQLGYYTIQGAIASPGKYPLNGKTSITEAIAMAGGVRDRAKLNVVQILRTTDAGSKTITMDVGRILSGSMPNIDIQNQDNIVIPAGGEKTDIFKIASLALGLAWLFVGR